MDEKKDPRPTPTEHDKDAAFFMQLLQQQPSGVTAGAGNAATTGSGATMEEDKDPEDDERAAGDVSFTLEETCRLFLQGSNAYVSEILRTAFQHKKRGKSLLVDNDLLFQELQELDEKMFYVMAAVKLGLKAFDDLEVEVDQAKWYYERIEDPVFKRLLRVVDARNNKIMSLLTTQELDTADILEIQTEVEQLPDEKGVINPADPSDIKWLANLVVEQETHPDEDETPPEPIVPIDAAPATVAEVMQVFRKSTTDYFSRVLDLADKWLAEGKTPKISAKGFQREYKAIVPNRRKALVDAKLTISEDEYDMAIMFYTQTQHPDLKKDMAAINSVTQSILAKLQGEGLTKADVAQFRVSLKFD